MPNHARSGQRLVDVRDNVSALPAQNLRGPFGLIVAYSTRKDSRGVVRGKIGVAERSDLNLLRIDPEPLL
jgi:hypothetical protein